MRKGLNDGLGDLEVILDSMRFYGLNHVEPYPRSSISFASDKMYGDEREPVIWYQTFQDFAYFFDAGAMVPRFVGELILTRKNFSLPRLNPR